MQQTKLKVLDLFSGIGGFSLGLESLGQFETIESYEKRKNELEERRRIKHEEK